MLVITAIVVISSCDLEAGPFTVGFVSQDTSNAYYNMIEDELATLVAAEPLATLVTGSTAAEFASGRACMAYIGHQMSGTGDICIITGPIGHAHAINRTERYNDELTENYPGITVLATEAGDWGEATAESIVDIWLANETYDNLDAIICNNDTMAFGAITAVNNDERAGIKIVGFDGSADAVDAVDAGTMLTTADQSPVNLAAKVIADIQRIEAGETLEKDLSILADVINSANVADYQ